MMECPELFISVGEIIGVPKVTARGCMDGWHDQAIRGVLEGIGEQGSTSLVLDLTGLRFAGPEAAAGLISVLRSMEPGLCVHVIASDTSQAMLAQARLSPYVKLYTSTDEIAEYLTPNEYYTSRWMAAAADGDELPLAA